MRCTADSKNTHHAPLGIVVFEKLHRTRLILFLKKKQQLHIYVTNKIFLYPFFSQIFGPEKSFQFRILFLNPILDLAMCPFLF